MRAPAGGKAWRGGRRESSGASLLMCWVEALELDAGVGGGEAPLDGPGGDVARGDPGGHLARHGLPVAQSSVEALALEDGELDLGHVEPRGVFRRVVALPPGGPA